jgi:hypothetical protein
MKGQTVVTAKNDAKLDTADRIFGLSSAVKYRQKKCARLVYDITSAPSQPKRVRLPVFCEAQFTSRQ